MDNKVMPNCLPNKKLQPHPWTTADLAFSELRDETKNQAVLICGESGSGKTEATKFVLQYLVGKNGASVDQLEDVRHQSALKMSRACFVHAHGGDSVAVPLFEIRI